MTQLELFLSFIVLIQIGVISHYRRKAEFFLDEAAEAMATANLVFNSFAPDHIKEVARQHKQSCKVQAGEAR